MDRLFTLGAALLATATFGFSAPRFVTAWQYDCPTTSGTRISIHEDNGRRRMIIADRDRCLSVRSEGLVAFSENDDDVERLASRGYLHVMEMRGGTTREMQLDERGGRIERRYLVNNREQPAAEGADWLRNVLPQLARESSIGAEARVSRILRKAGPAGVLAELPQISSESIKSLYVDSLMRDRRTTSADLRTLARQAPKLFSSDSKRTNMLVAILDRSGADSELAGTVIEASTTTSSDRQRGILLRSAIARGSMTQAMVLATLRAADGISSDREKAEVLIALTANRGVLTDDGVRKAFLTTTRRISSSSEYRRVMEALVR